MSNQELPKYAKRQQYDKLVRDKIPIYLDSLGKPYQAHEATPSEYREQLLKKLLEEANEFVERDHSPEELVDILEVVYALADEMGISLDELEELRQRKAQERGEFKKHIILEWS